MQKRTDFFDNSLLSIVPDIPLVIRNKPHNNQLCTDLFRFISAYPVVSHFLRFAWQTTMTSDYSSESIRELYERNFDTLYRVCYMYMKNIQDTEDAVHNAFLKAIETRKQFESENHEKAWLIRVASNICKNMLKAACRKNEPLNDNIPDSNISNEAKELLSELSKLPDKLKIPVYLFYYDGYSSEEIGQMLHISSSAVRTRLQKAREQLRNVLGDERSVE